MLAAISLSVSRPALKIVQVCWRAGFVRPSILRIAMTELLGRRLLLDLVSPIAARCNAGVAVRSAFFNARSMSFPVAEPYFIGSVRNGLISAQGLAPGACWWIRQREISATRPLPGPSTMRGPPATYPSKRRRRISWIQGLRECIQVARQLPDTRLVCVMDREADFFELFDERRQSGRVDLLVRAKHDRATAGDLHLFDSVRGSPVQARMRIDVPRQSARPKKSKQKARAGHPQRTAQVALRYCEVELRPPAQHSTKPPIKLWVVRVSEMARPSDAQPVEWFLLSTRPITCVEQAQECLRWYCLRWRIEDWHRVLKSGCRIEALQHKTAERLKRAIAINLVIAWRIMLMTLLGRQCPDLPADVLFSDIEVEVLQAYAKKTASTHRACSAMPYA